MWSLIQRLSKQLYPGYFPAATALPDRTLPSPPSARASRRRNRLINISGRVKLFRPPSLTPAQKETGATCRPRPLKELKPLTVRKCLCFHLRREKIILPNPPPLGIRKQQCRKLPAALPAAVRNAI